MPIIRPSFEPAKSVNVAVWKFGASSDGHSQKISPPNPPICDDELTDREDADDNDSDELELGTDHVLACDASALRDVRFLVVR